MINENLYNALKASYPSSGKIKMDFTQEKSGKIFMTASIPMMSSVTIVIMADDSSEVNVIGKWQKFPATMLTEAIQVWENGKDRMC